MRAQQIEESCLLLSRVGVTASRKHVPTCPRSHAGWRFLESSIVAAGDRVFAQDDGQKLNPPLHHSINDMVS